MFMNDTFWNIQNLNADVDAGSGEIVVISMLESEKNELLQGIKINLYEISGLSPVLIESKITDQKGTAIFEKIENGCYRVIEIVDKRYFQKPKYIKWNELTIDEENKKQKIVIINKIKMPGIQSKHNI